MQNVMEGQAPAVTAQLVSEDGGSWVLQYFLQTYQSTDETPMFGVRVEKLTQEGKLLESNETFAITASRDEALDIADYLAKGTVPPCVLMDLVEEWFAVKESN